MSKIEVGHLMAVYENEYEDVRPISNVSDHGGNRISPNLTWECLAALREYELLRLVKIIVVDGILFEDVTERHVLNAPVELSVIGNSMVHATVGYVEETDILVIC